MLKKLVFVSIIFLFGSCQKGQKSYLYDNANLLTDVQRNQLDGKLREYKKNTTAEIVVFTKEDLRNYAETPAEYSKYLLNDLKVGKKGINNGILIFISLQEKAVELRVGYGVEWVLNKKEIEDIVSLFLFYFREGKFYEGLDSGINKIKEKLSGISWQLCDQEDYTVGCIKKLQIKKVIKVEDQYVEVQIEDGRLYNMLYTDFMHSLMSHIVDDLVGKDIYVRLKGKNEILFLGIDQ
ncbi:MAG: TPM domain-containing protein [Chitinophagaceae bacterium]|nr:TPM domain-containing protein [Chitinophagaceae bacterium]